MPPDRLDAMVDHVLALREEVIAARVHLRIHRERVGGTSARLIGPLPEQRARHLARRRKPACRDAQEQAAAAIALLESA